MDIRERLSRLGLQKGTAGIRPRDGRRALDIDHLTDGRVVETQAGSFFLAEMDFEAEYEHGTRGLGASLEVNPSGLETFLGSQLGIGFDLRRAVYIDTETTGLAGGTGTYAFLVGIGFFEGDRFRVMQFFMRDFDEELALLHQLCEVMAGTASLVSFNGRAFDLPLLETRLITSRVPHTFKGIPHLDLLPPARKLWRSRVGSCKLTALEDSLLGVCRTSEDVPGWLIPSLYFEYLHTRDAREMVQVLYHNLQDVLSMVTLATLICEALTEPLVRDRPHLDSFSLAKWCENKGRWREAEDLYLRAMAGPLPLDERRKAISQLAFLLKRQERGAEAAPLWTSLSTDPIYGLLALEELAKWEEWRTGNVQAAEERTSQALAWMEVHLQGRRQRRARESLTHRLQRLQRKLTNS